MAAVASSSTGGVGGRLYGFLKSIPTWVLWIMVVIWSIPTLGLFVNSFRTRDNQLATGWWQVFSDQGGLTLENYQEVLFSDAGGALFDAAINSLSIVIPGTIIPIALAAFAAYAFAWIEFRGREWLFIATVSLLAIPLQMSLIPLLQMYSRGAHLTLPVIEKTVTLFPDLSISGEFLSVWLTHTGFGMPFAIFLLHNYISGLPKDIFESAFIDGADHFTIFWRLVLPLSVPVLAAFTIFQFLWTWNDYLIALTMLGGGNQNLPITVKIASLAGEFGLREHILGAGAFISMVLPLVVFFALQRYFVSGILAGSVKG